MNERTARQIEEMKKQTIGVEVEMNHIKREKAAKIAASSLEQKDLNTRHPETDTAPGQHGMRTAGNGNFREIQALWGLMKKNVRWSHRSFITATLKSFRSW